MADHSRGLAQEGTDFQSLPNAVIALLPTPAVNDMGAAYTPEEWDAWTAEMKARHNNGNGHGKSFNVEAQRLLPTPQARDEKGYGPADLDRKDPNLSALPMLLPTPTANEAEKAIQGPRTSDGQKYLSNVVHELLPTPRATDGTNGGPNQRGSSGDLMLPSAVQKLLPTPTAQDSAQSGGSTASDVTLTDAVVRTEMATRPNPRLLPTPEAADASGGRKSTEFGGQRASGAKRSVTLATAVDLRWGEYEPAIRRWEAITRPAPEPTKLNTKGKPKLSDEFDEWLMGLPSGWITDVPSVTWNEALKACGNGVVPQQCAAALRYLGVLAAWTEVAA